MIQVSNFILTYDQYSTHTYTYTSQQHGNFQVCSKYIQQKPVELQRKAKGNTTTIPNLQNSIPSFNLTELRYNEHVPCGSNIILYYQDADARLSGFGYTLYFIHDLQAWRLQTTALICTRFLGVGQDTLYSFVAHTHTTHTSHTFFFCPRFCCSS